MVMTPQLRKLIDDVNSRDRIITYKTTDGYTIKLTHSQGMLAVQCENPILLKSLMGVIGLALKGQLQRKPLTKDKN